MLIRQFRLWNLQEIIDEEKDDMFYIEIIENVQRNNILLVIDSLVNSEKKFKGYDSAGYGITSNNQPLDDDIGDFYGYSPVEKEKKIKELFLCLETEECKPIVNLRYIDNIEIKHITPSGTGRYTMEFWVKINSLAKFLNGINVVWEDHMSISILTDALKGKLSLYCFTQDYLTSPLGLKGRDIISVASEKTLNVENIDDLEINNFDNSWFYIRCAYNWDNEIYYFRYNNKPINEKSIKHENASEGKSTDYPYKFLFIEPFENYNLYIENAKENSKCDVYIRTLYLYNEFLPVNYDTTRVLFNSENSVLWNVFGVDFIDNTEKSGQSLVLKFFKKDQNENILEDTNIEIIDEENYLSKGGVVLCEATKRSNSGSSIIYGFNSNTNECIKVSTDFTDLSNEVEYDGYPLQCKSGNYLDVTGGLSCSNNCPDGYNRGPGSHLDMDKPIVTALCNYKNDKHQYNEPNNFEAKLTCTNESLIRVGYKCFDKKSQEKSALYFNRCYNFYPVYAYFDSIRLRFIEGYILEFSFKIDLVNDFCSRENIDERYIFFAHPHAIIQDKNDKFYYKDTNYFNIPNFNNKLEQISLYEWNHVIIEFRPKEFKMNIYLNYNLDEPAYSYSIEESDINNYYLRYLLFCSGNYLCSPIGDHTHIKWGAAYYSQMRIYNLKYSSIYMAYENMRKKFNSSPNSIVVYYLFNTINNDLNIFHDKYSNINLDFNGNRPIVSVYLADERVLMFSSSSSFDFGEFHPGVHATSVEPLTGKYSFTSCYDKCKRCYSGKINDCYECDDDSELYKNQCREITGYYYELPNINVEIELKTNGTLIKYNPITVTLWVKYYGIQKDFGSSDDCILLIRFSNEDNIYICHKQGDNTLLMKKDNDILFSDRVFLDNLGTWQLISVSNYKCKYNNKDTCDFYPSMLSLSINGQAASSINKIPLDGIILNKIIFGYGIIMTLSDVNIYKTFILNPLGIVSNYASYQNNLVSSINLHLKSDTRCIEQHVLEASDGRDMYNQQIGHCIKDYNIYHDFRNHYCNDENKMINISNINDADKECIECIDECTHCAGGSKLNCACYFDENYWFRKDKDTNRLFCQIVPYIDLNKYSELEFSEIKYATTNEFAIEFWYFIYDYGYEYTREISFFKQIISWESHIKIEISKYSNNVTKVECFPINERDESIASHDISQKYFQWNHVICATDLNNRIYYINKEKVTNIIGEEVKRLNYSTYDNRRVTLKFQSFNNYDDRISYGVFLLKELRLYNFFSIREFNTKCFYNYDWAKNNDVPNILHYFPFNMKKDGIVQDAQGNEPSQKSLKNINNTIGYNIIDIENKYNIDEEFEECLIINIIPSKVYFNLTNVLIYNYEIEPKTYPFYNYEYKYYISEKAEVSYSDIIKTNLITENNPRELLLKKFKDNKFNGVQLNIYITLTERNNIDIVHSGFNLIRISSYYPGNDIDFETYCRGIQDNLEVDIAGNKYPFTDIEIWNRLYLYESLGNIHIMALNESNRTSTFLDYYYDDKAISYFPKNIIIKNPVCNDNYCSGKGKCIIIVRDMVCLCNNGYSGRNCHLTTKNKNYLSETNLKLWNYLTNNNEFSNLEINNKFLYKITYLIKSSTIFDDSFNQLINNFFTFLDYLKTNHYNLMINEINLIFDTISYIIINLYYDISQFRAKNYEAINENQNYKNNEKIGEVNLNNEQVDTVYQLSYKITTKIPELILNLIKLNKRDMFQNYTAFDYTVKTISHSFDYLEYFENLHINNRDKYNSYLPFIDAYNCADYIFGSTPYTTIFLVIINYHYDPLSYHSLYSYSASYSLDVFYATQIGTKLDVKACPHYIDIYFPLNLYNESEIQFINSHAKFLSSNTNIKLNDPYITWPVYVDKKGKVSKKSRYQRINEVLPMIKINCSYYNDKLALSSNISNTIVSDKYYLICRTNHLSFYTIQSEKSGYKYKEAGIFFYLGAPQVLICGENWTNGCTIILLLSLLIFGFFIGLFLILERTLMATKENLNNVKLEILKQNRLIFDELDLLEEITKANKMNEQENMAKNLKIQVEEDKLDKDLKQNLYLYGTKNIDYNDMAFKGGEIGEELDNGHKGVFSNPPKKHKNGFIIDDLDDGNISSEKDSEAEKETRLKKSINIVNKKRNKKKSTSKVKPKTQDLKKQENKKEDLRFYRVKEYNPEKTEQIDKFNYNIYKESDFGFNQSESSEENNYKETSSNREEKKSKIKDYNSSIRESTDELKIKDKKEKKEKKKKKKDENSKKSENDKKNGEDNKKEGDKINDLNNIQYNDDDDDDNNENLDYFSKYKTVIKNENKKGKKVNIKKGNYTIVDKYRKVTFVKEKYYSLDISGFFEHLNKLNPSVIKLFWHLFLRRNIYISPFMVSSTINPRYRRILCLYMYILLQIFFLTIGLSIAERISISNGQKIMLFQLINILLADIIIIIAIPLFRIPTILKRKLFLNFKSTQQMLLLKIFKQVKEVQRKKFPYIVGIMSGIFVIAFYFSFHYCSVLYYSRWLFAECFFVGILLDFALYEGVLNGLICLFYYLKNKKKCFITPYVYLFLFRNYRACF